ncbi:glycine cleavage system protein R [Desulfovermiculus halophilus]|jgi:glycine cleavage system transcriptional repressor|uniref:glycine cleavage system protein R n=1 Tax=Desulfovermiculus halophilus TaxID=339722 RepID=UPI000486A7B1|nr:ACT domain-containing protein [Desulfovermiculus halophilus]
MSTRYILTAFGRDRVGIVADVTQVMYELDCNLEDSEMTRLADEFAVIFLFSAPTPEIEDKLTSACRRLELDKGIAAFFRPLGSPEPQKGTGILTTLHVEGVDQCGIIYHISRHLAENKVNIIRVHSRQSSSPQSGTAMYTVDLEVELPSHMSMQELNKGLQHVADALHLDIQTV